MITLKEMLDDRHLRGEIKKAIDLNRKNLEDDDAEEIEESLNLYSEHLFLPIFQRHLQRSLPVPHVITAEELASDFHRDVLRFFFAVEIDFVAVFEKLFEPVFETFKSSALRRIRLRSSPPLKCFSGSLARYPFTDDDAVKSGEVGLWHVSLDREFKKFSGVEARAHYWSVFQSGFLPADNPDESEEAVDVFVTIEGKCSPGAMQNMVRDLDGILKVIYQCHAMIYGSRYRDSIVDEFSTCDLNFAWIFGDDADTSEGDSDAVPQPDLKIEENQSPENGQQKREIYWNAFFQNVRELLKAVIAPEKKKKDSISKRIRIALKLMAKAQEESDDGLSLALYVGAMEALLSKKGSNVSQMFADILARLLEPSPKHRAAAVDYVSRLYEIRSNVLHGSDDNANSIKRNDVQFLAYAVLTAYLERFMQLKKQDGAPERPEDLLKELKKDRFSEGPPYGVQESPVVNLWRG